MILFVQEGRLNRTRFLLWYLLFIGLDFLFQILYPKLKVTFSSADWVPLSIGITFIILYILPFPLFLARFRDAKIHWSLTLLPLLTIFYSLWGFKMIISQGGDAFALALLAPFVVMVSQLIFVVCIFWHSKPDVIEQPKSTV